MKKTNLHGEQSFAIGRRELVLGLLGTSAAVLLSPRLAFAQTSANSATVQPKVVFSDNLSIPIPADPSSEEARTEHWCLVVAASISLPGCSVSLMASMPTGCRTKYPKLLSVLRPGSVVGSAIAGSHLRRLTKEFDFFGSFPKILAALVPTATPNPSEIRARELCQIARDASIETIQSIGRGAMAAKNPPVSKLQDMIEVLTGNHSWPSQKFHATTMDCYSGERLVVSEANQIPISHAASASMSLPGIFGPTWIDDWIGMDGGMSSSSTHSDLVAGAKRALVVSLTDGSSGSGPRFSNIPDAIQQELRDLEASGTRALLIAANPGQVNLVSPAEIGPALRAGNDRAVKEAERVKAFWA